MFIKSRDSDAFHLVELTEGAGVEIDVQGKFRDDRHADWAMGQY
jgi:hypothetical protein